MSREMLDLRANYIELGELAGAPAAANADSGSGSDAATGISVRKIKYSVSECGGVDWWRVCSALYMCVCVQEFRFISPHAPLGKGAFGVV
jgi:hypothetical protein